MFIEIHQIVEFMSGATVFGIIAHAVNTFPTPKSPLGGWALGVIQFAVGQRIAAKNTLAGSDSIVSAVPRGTQGMPAGTQGTLTDHAHSND